MVTIEPGGIFGPIHDHRGRPGTVYILQGTITDHRNGVATDYGPGVGWPEDRNTIHWLRTGDGLPRWRSRSTSSAKSDSNRWLDGWGISRRQRGHEPIAIHRPGNEEALAGAVDADAPKRRRERSAGIADAARKEDAVSLW